MKLEVEGKWLNPRNWETLVVRSTRIKQGYLTESAPGSNSNLVRIRSGGGICTLTVKSAPVASGAKPEGEGEISPELFDTLWPFTNGHIDKTRHIVPLGKLLLPDPTELFAEIDEFHGDLAGLVVAEIEVPSVEHLAELRRNPPNWLGEDVTDDPRYGNNQLAKNGIPSRD